MFKKVILPWLVIWGVVFGVLAVLHVVFAGYRPFRDIIWSVNVNPWAWVTGLLCLVFLSFYLGEEAENLGCLPAITATGFAVISTFFMIGAGPLMLIGLRAETEYLESALVPISRIRDVPYAEAERNLTGKVADPRYQIGDLDYIRGRWVAPLNPKGIWGRFIYKTSGFLVYEPDLPEKVQLVKEEMPYAETAIGPNSIEAAIRFARPFTEFYEILYIMDPDTEEIFAMISLISRKGWRRVPYVSEILLIHQNGDKEFIKPKKAERDPRLAGVQLKPEQLMRWEVEAYGWGEGFWQGWVLNKGRVRVQESEINKENAAPYHLETEDGNFWYTPYGPLNQTSMTGVAMSYSGQTASPVLIWKLPGGSAYQGVDTLAIKIRGAPGHPTGINWARGSTTTVGDKTATVVTGDTDIIELIPVPRQEGSQVKLYLMGYVTTLPPADTRFFVIIDPEKEIVYEDLFTVQEVNGWLAGKREIRPQEEMTRPSAPSQEGPTEEEIIKQIEELLKLLKNKQ